jgi:NitT/TauT family transport system ATP-binding protein
MLEEVGLSGFRSHYPFQLSGGMKQRAAIARVLVNQSEILLMDEPFGALDAQTRLKLQMLLIRVQAQLQKTVIFVTYDVDEALFISHRIVVLSARPARIVEILNVDQPHPQDMSFITSDQFSQLKQRVLFLLFGGAA